MQFDYKTIMSNNKNIETIHPDDFPPRFDTYYQDEENERVFISNLCQPSEKEEEGSWMAKT